MPNNLLNSLKNLWNSNRSPSSKKSPTKYSNQYYIINYPKKGEDVGPINGNTPGQAARKAFNRLCRDMNFYDNKNGTLYLGFTLRDVKYKRNHDYIGTMTKLGEPLYRKIGNKSMKIEYRPIVAKFTRDMQDVFFVKK